MAKAKEPSHIASPPGWIQLVTEKMDFEGAFNALAEYHHFHTDTLRGKVRSLQLRLQDARRHFEKAEELCKKQKSPKENVLPFFYLRAYSLDNTILEEGMHHTEAARERTDLELQRFLDAEDPATPVTDQIRINGIGFYQIVRGDYRSALQTFETLLEESRFRLEDQKAAFFCGAAAAAKALGLDETGQRHYENAALMVGTLEQPFKRAIVAAKLYALMTHWERAGEAEEWMETLKRLPTSEESRTCFIKRAEMFTTASAVRDRIFIA